MIPKRIGKIAKFEILKIMVDGFNHSTKIEAA